MPILAQPQRGVATLAIVLVLFFALSLSLAFANRGLVFEQRASANQLRATLAFEAAEAGVEWAQALLNGHQTLDEDCLPSAAPGATTLRDRWLTHDTEHHRLVPKAGAQGQPLQAACQRQAGGWLCHCPADGKPVLQAPVANALAPAYTVELQAGSEPGQVVLVSRGCGHADSACLQGGPNGAQGESRVQLTLALVGGLRTWPAAALTTQSNVEGFSPGAHSHGPTAGAAVHAGGLVTATHLRASHGGGGSLAEAVVAGDQSLQQLPKERLFSQLFGIDKASWSTQPSVAGVVCQDACNGAVLAALGQHGNRLLHVGGSGGLQLHGPLTLGSPERPVLLVSEGPVEWTGNIVFHGLVYAPSFHWNGTATAPPAGLGAFLHGALVSEGPIGTDSAPDIVRDEAVLQRLRWHMGSLVKVPGSWQDFKP